MIYIFILLNIVSISWCNPGRLNSKAVIDHRYQSDLLEKILTMDVMAKLYKEVEDEMAGEGISSLLPFQGREETPETEKFKAPFSYNAEDFKTSGKNVMQMVQKIKSLIEEDKKGNPDGKIRPALYPHTEITDPTDLQDVYSNVGRLDPKPDDDSSPVRKPQPSYPTQHNTITGPHDHGYGYGKHSLDLHDYKAIWINMMYALHKVLKDPKLLKEDSTKLKALKQVFYMLQRTNLVDYQYTETKSKCPYSYNPAGDLCLSVEHIEEKLTWEEARNYCQLIKGGDLVVFKDACEFEDTVKYLKHIDKEGKYSYWFGGSDLDHEGNWKYIDGTIVHQHSPFWGNHLKEEEPSGGNNQNYGVLLGGDGFLMHDISNLETKERLKVLPLCQYIPDRDGTVNQQNKPKGWGPYLSYNDYYGQSSGGYGNTGYGNPHGGYSSSAHGGLYENQQSSHGYAPHHTKRKENFNRF